MIIHSLRDKGFFHLLSVNFLTQFLGFGTVLLVAKFLTPVELGEIKILQSYTMIFILLGGFGFNAAVLKTCSENRSLAEKEGILRFALTRSLISISISVLILIALAFTGVITSSHHLSFWLMIYAILTPFAVATDILIVFLQSQKKIKAMARAQIFIKGQSFLIIVLSTWIWGFRGFIFATIIAYGVGLFSVLKQTGLDFFASKIKILPSYFVHTAVFSVLSNGISLLGQYGDIFILDHFTNNRREIGYYSLATIFLQGANQITSTVQSITTPYFSERAKDKVWFRHQLIKNQLRMVPLSIAVAALVYLLAWILVHIFYGPEYYSTLTYLLILLIKYVLWSSYALTSVALFGFGLVHYNFIAATISTLMGLTLSYIFLEHFGIVGVAWAQVSAASILLMIMILLAKRVFYRIDYSFPERGF
jgi:O-antigen/teichoic acid export membrane protein